MNEISLEQIVFSFLVTWVVVLTPPMIIRFLRKKSLSKPIAIGLTIVFYIVNLLLFLALGSQSKSHIALTIGAIFSYQILRYKSKYEQKQDMAAQRKELGYEE